MSGNISFEGRQSQLQSIINKMPTSAKAELARQLLALLAQQQQSQQGQATPVQEQEEKTDDERANRRFSYQCHKRWHEGRDLVRAIRHAQFESDFLEFQRLVAILQSIEDSLYDAGRNRDTDRFAILDAFKEGKKAAKSGPRMPSKLFPAPKTPAPVQLVTQPDSEAEVIGEFDLLRIKHPDGTDIAIYRGDMAERVPPSELAFDPDLCALFTKDSIAPRMSDENLQRVRDALKIISA